MDDDTKYGQFCPVAKAAEIVTTRWTPLILRELISGSQHFNEIHRGVPLMSRGLLSKRLKDLEEWGVVVRHSDDRPNMTAYSLTQSGEALGPIIMALGQWGRDWVESALAKEEWDAGVLMWDLRRRINRSALPKGRTVINFDLEGAVDEMRVWWVVIDDSGVDLCQKDPGYEVDLYINSSVQTLAEVWIGKKNLKSEIRNDTILLTGDKGLESTIESWMELALVTEVKGQLTWTDAAE